MTHREGSVEDGMEGIQTNACDVFKVRDHDAKAHQGEENKDPPRPNLLQEIYDKNILLPHANSAIMWFLFLMLILKTLPHLMMQRSLKPMDASRSRTF